MPQGRKSQAPSYFSVMGQVPSLGRLLVISSRGNATSLEIPHLKKIYCFSLLRTISVGLIVLFSYLITRYFYHILPFFTLSYAFPPPTGTIFRKELFYLLVFLSFFF
jgi:hypothetical protein